MLTKPPPFSADQPRARLFVAVSPPSEVKRSLAAHLNRFTPNGNLPGRVVLSQNWHITLLFVGSADQVGFEKLLFGLSEAPLGDRFPLELGRLGAFPHPRRASVLWQSTTTGTDRLTELAEQVQLVGEHAGFGRELRPFRSHLTLSRLRPPQDLSSLIEGIPSPKLSYLVSELIIFHSRLGSSGVVYEPLESFPLD